MSATLGERLSAARRKAHLTQAAAAKAVGKTPQAISDYENNRYKPDDDVLERMAVVYGVPEPELRYPPQAGTRAAHGTERPMPRVTRSHAVRVWLKEFELELLRAGVPEERIAEAIDVLTAPQVLHYFVGGRERELAEAEAVQLMSTMADAIRQDLRQRGFKLPSAP